MCIATEVRADDRVTITMGDGPGTTIAFGANVVATYYSHGDAQILRPFLAQVRTLNGLEVTRAYPPREGVDATDHANMHPGTWLAFGDIDGIDFWRNEGHVQHEGLVNGVEDGPNFGAFAEQYSYIAPDGRRVCKEVRTMSIRIRGDRIFLLVDSVFRGERDFTFGDQEEMGLGIRVATPIAVENGGTIRNNDGLLNEAGCWGKQALWAEYSGSIEGERVAVVLMPHPQNFRPSWFHARDYGLLVANPFGRQAFTGGEPSRVEVRAGEEFRLAFGVCVYTGVAAADDAYAAYLDMIGAGELGGGQQ